MTLDAATLSPREIYGFLAGAVAPRPICFASTVAADGRINLSPFSFFNVVSGDPPLLAFSPLLSGRDGSSKDTLNNVRAVPEVVINVVDYAQVEQMSLASTAYPPEVNEFTKAGLTEIASDVVRPPRVATAPVAFECRVDRVLTLGTGPMGGNLILARVLRIHVRDGLLDAEGQLDHRRLDLVGRMGGSDYIRALPAALFEIPKPVRSLGIGVDALPAAVRNSRVLTGNHLGRLGNAERLPTAEEIAATAEDSTVGAARSAGTEALHALAREILEAGDTDRALRVLLVAE